MAATGVGRTVPTGVTAHLSVLLSRVGRKIYADLASLLADDDVTPDQWCVLEVLADGGGWPMGELADHAELHGPTVTKACDRLIERGLIYRRQDDADRRRVVVHLSADGVRLLTVLRERVDAQQRLLEDRLGTDGAAELTRLLHILSGVDPR